MAPPPWRDWLSHRESLTARLVAHCDVFEVQCLHQRVADAMLDEIQAMQLSVPGKVHERDVLLHCDGQPMVYAHSVLPLQATAQQWPLFAGLGNRSLGTILFQDPLVRRGPLHYARLRQSHPLARRIAAMQLSACPPSSLLARRSLFTRKRIPLLVTEVFLPSLSTLFQP